MNLKSILAARMHHLRHGGLVLIMAGLLVQWPTLGMLVIVPVLVLVYVHLERCEERDVIAEFGTVYPRYEVASPACIPRFGGSHGAV